MILENKNIPEQNQIEKIRWLDSWRRSWVFQYKDRQRASGNTENQRFLNIVEEIDNKTVVKNF